MVFSGEIKRKQAGRLLSWLPLETAQLFPSVPLISIASWKIPVAGMGDGGGKGPSQSWLVRGQRPLLAREDFVCPLWVTLMGGRRF